jgi:hypothetical protein
MVLVLARQELCPPAPVAVLVVPLVLSNTTQHLHTECGECCSLKLQQQHSRVRQHRGIFNGFNAMEKEEREQAVQAQQQVEEGLEKQAPWAQ